MTLLIPLGGETLATFWGDTPATIGVTLRRHLVSTPSVGVYATRRLSQRCCSTVASTTCVKTLVVGRTLVLRTCPDLFARASWAIGRIISRAGRLGDFWIGSTSEVARLTPTWPMYGLMYWRLPARRRLARPTRTNTADSLNRDTEQINHLHSAKVRIPRVSSTNVHCHHERVAVSLSQMRKRRSAPPAFG